MQLPAPRYTGCPSHPFPQGEGDSSLKGNWDVWAPNRPPHKGCIRGRDPVNYRCAMLSGISSNREMYTHTDMRPRHEMGIVCKSMRPHAIRTPLFPGKHEPHTGAYSPTVFSTCALGRCPCPVVSSAQYASIYCAFILFSIICKLFAIFNIVYIDFFLYSPDPSFP